MFAIIAHIAEIA